MGEEIFGKRAGDAAADEIKAALAVGKQRGDAVERRGVEIGQRLAQIAMMASAKRLRIWVPGAFCAQRSCLAIGFEIVASTS